MRHEFQNLFLAIDAGSKVLRRAGSFARSVRVVGVPQTSASGSKAAAKRAIACGIVLCAVAIPSAHAQLGLPIFGGGSDNSSDTDTGVYVKESAIAMERLALAQRLEKQKEWNKSAEVYQEIIEKYREPLVASSNDAAGRGGPRYTSVTEKVRQAICRWPPEGLRVYRAIYEASAQHVLANAAGGDLAPLHEVFNRYFATESGKIAGIRLIDAYFELGDFPAASRIGLQLLTLPHPTLDADRPKVLYRVAMACHLSGDDSTATTFAGELRSEFPQAIGTLRGGDVVLADALDQDIESTPATGGTGSYASASDSWPMFGGNPLRSKVPAAECRPGAKLFSVDLTTVNWRQRVADPNQRRNLSRQDLLMRGAGNSIGVMPVLDNGELFFQDNVRVYAVSAESGAPLPGWASTYAGSSGRYVIPTAWPTPPGKQLTLTLSSTSVLAVMNLPDFTATSNGLLTDREPRLVCLDRATGKERWTVTAKKLPAENNAGLTELQFDGSPLVIGENVYLTARGSRGNQSENCYVLCFDLGTGKYKWSCYVVGATSNPTLMNQDAGVVMMTTTSAPAHLAYAGGRLFIVTQLGAVAALDAYSGTVAWLNIYRDRNDMNYTGGGGMDVNGIVARNAPPPWSYNPAVIQDGKFFVMPTDGRYLLIYDAASGKELKRIARDNFRDSGGTLPTTLVGVLGNRLVIAGLSRSVCLDWTRYESNRPKACIEWDKTIVGGDRNRDVNAIQGRPFLTSETEFLPGVSGLQMVQLRNGAVGSVFPRGGTWGDGQGPGNVIVTSDRIIIAGDRRVDVYTDMDQARKRLEGEIVLAPASAEARLRFAEVMFNAGQEDAAITRLDEAIKLLGGLPALRPGAGRDRVFADALNFATKVSLSTANRPDAGDVANGLFDRAGSAASSPSQQAAYRLARAKFARDQQKDIVQAITLYQQVLGDDAMRIVSVPDDSDPDNADADASMDSAASGNSSNAHPSQAGLVAERSINLLLKTSAGAAAYAVFEQKAAEQLNAAKAANDPAGLLAVASTYPNARIAPEAMFQASAVFESKAESRHALPVLRQLYARLSASDPAAVPDRLRLLEAMARNTLAIPDRIGRFEAAAARLSLAASLSSDGHLMQPITLPDGKTLADVSYLDAKYAIERLIPRQVDLPLPVFNFPSREAVREMATKQKKALPLLAPEDPATVIEGVESLVRLLPEYGRFDRIAGWSKGQGLAIYTVGQSTARGACREISETPTGGAWIGKNLLVWSGSQVAMVSGEDASLIWRMPLQSLPAVDMVGGDEVAVAPSPAVDQLTEGNAQFNPQFNPRRIQMQRQELAMRRALLARAQGGVIIQPPLPVQPIAVGGEPSSTSTADARPPLDQETIKQVVPTGDRVLIGTSTGRVLSVDPADGRLIWQTRVTTRPVDRLLANEDFAVLRLIDDATVQLIVLDSYTGKLAARKAFPREGDLYPINLALGSDDTLVWVTSTRLIIKDLFEPKLEPTRQWPDNGNAPGPPANDATPRFAVCTQPDQLLITNGQALVLADGGQNVRVFNLETGTPRKYPSPDTHLDTDKPLATKTSRAETAMKLVGSYVYIWSPNSLIVYDVNRGDSWDRPDTRTNFLAARELMLGRDFVALWSDQGARGADAIAQSGVLEAFSRQKVVNSDGVAREGGGALYPATITDRQGILAWQAVDGGVYYLSGDHKLHLLKGNGTPRAKTAPATRP